MFTIPSLHLCEQKGDSMPIASQPAYFVARQLVPGLDRTSCATWERVVFRNGAHRWAAASAVPNVPAGLCVERLIDFDELVLVGHLAAFTEWNPADPNTVGPVIALARLCSVRTGSGQVHQGQSYDVQQWQTLAVLGGHRG